MKKPKGYWTAKTLPTLIGQRNGQLTVRAIYEVLDPIKMSALETDCDCGAERYISWIGFVAGRNLACVKCLKHREKLATLRRQQEARDSRSIARKKVNAAQPVRVDCVTPAYRALTADQQELVDLIVRSRNPVVIETGFEERAMAEAIEMVKLFPRAEILRDFAPSRRDHADLYNVRRYEF